MHLTPQYPVVEINIAEKCSYVGEEDEDFISRITNIQPLASINYLRISVTFLKKINVF